MKIISYILILLNVYLCGYDLYAAFNVFDFSDLEGRQVANAYGVIVAEKFFIVIYFLIENMIVSYLMIVRKKNSGLMKVISITAIVGLIISMIVIVWFSETKMN